MVGKVVKINKKWLEKLQKRAIIRLEKFLQGDDDDAAAGNGTKASEVAEGRKSSFYADRGTSDR
nr:hypothetical protein [uncultured Marvinbryantia sp.]